MKSSVPGKKVNARSNTVKNPTGTIAKLENPVDRGYLCAHMCRCSATTRFISKDGKVLKQRCTTVSVWEEEEKIGQLVWRYKAEVGYNMATNPPSPIMSKDQPHRASRFPLGASIRDGILKRDLEGRFQKGLLRVPDCIILKSTWQELETMRASGVIDWSRLIPVERNIETVLEIKFGDDRLSQAQERAYKRIAGDNKFRLLEDTDCNCAERERVQVKEPVRTPVILPTPSSNRRNNEGVALQPVKPQFEPAAPVDSGFSLSGFLKKATAVAGMVVVTGLVIAALPAEAAVSAVTGVALLVVGTTRALSNQKDKNTQV